MADYCLSNNFNLFFIGDSGMYTGQVNDEDRPDGKGSMKYENGVFYEGTWTDGCQDSAAASQYERIR